MSEKIIERRSADMTSVLENNTCLVGWSLNVCKKKTTGDKVRWSEKKNASAQDM